ncbi:MAG: allophanate hydrolase [Alphaproteobacteria bacterium]
MNFVSLREQYLRSPEDVDKVARDILARVYDADDGNVWIARVSDAQVLADAKRLSVLDPAELPLFGIPFAVKDNIDVAGMPTTAGCPEFAYTPDISAPVVARLIAAGAILIGKTNLDQFAAGLVGTRSPYGACENAFDPAYVSGGSSSGSAVSVARGLVSFSLGTDTAGSGRVPAAFNNIVGLKPSRGLLSTRGVVPACRTLDCISIFANCTADAQTVLDVAAGYDEDDAYSRDETNFSSSSPVLPRDARIGVPKVENLEFFGDAAAEKLFHEAVSRAEALGANIVQVDLAPFLEAARLLYEGPWVAERYVGIREFFDTHPDSLHPVTRGIIGGGAKTSAAEGFAAEYRMQALRRQVEPVWQGIDVIMTPTAGTIYTIAELEADPVQLNSNLGYYTNYMNLLDLCGMAVPAGFLDNGLPFGVTFVAPAFRDRAILPLADAMHRAAETGMGAARASMLDTAPDVGALGDDMMLLVVCGAHMSGLPLNHQLTERGAKLVSTTRSAPNYRFYALEAFEPPRPGMIRTESGGVAIDVEVWAIPQEHFGSFMAGIPGPLGIGTVELEDGSLVKGFICEGYAAEGALDISELRSWRGYLAAKS